jgi:predicted transcriptional regulator
MEKKAPRTAREKVLLVALKTGSFIETKMAGRVVCGMFINPVTAGRQARDLRADGMLKSELEGGRAVFTLTAKGKKFTNKIK